MTQIQQAVEILKKGGVIAYPTDTVYGLGGDAFNRGAAERIFKLKHRDLSRPLLVAVSDFQMMEQVAEVSNENRKICEQLFPGPFAVLLPKKKKLPAIVTSGKNLVGVRIPAHKTALELIKKAGFPIITTSANLSGEPAPIRPEDISLPVDYVVRGECRYGKPSTVIDLVNKKIIRQGPDLFRAKRALGIKE